MAKTPRTWTGARTPSGLKRVRQAQSRHDILQPRRTAAKTFVAKALLAAAQPTESTIDPEAALAEALSALDRAAKVGAIHPNAAARRKSRLTRKVNAALGGEHVQSGGRVVKTTGKAAAAKAAKARIAAGKAGKAKGAQTAAGKARAALSKTARAEAAAAKAAARGVGHDRRGGSGRQGTTTKATGTKATRSTKATATKAAPKKAATEGGAQGRTEGDRQGGAQGEEGHDQGIARHPRRTDDAPVRPGRFDSRALESGASYEAGRAGAGLGLRLGARRRGLRAEDAVQRRAAQATDRRHQRRVCWPSRPARPSRSS